MFLYLIYVGSENSEGGAVFYTINYIHKKDNLYK